jgi:hypothetical protein
MSDEPPEPGDYPVGRGKTPEHSRYKPGQSGNPKGRPKGARNMKTEFNEEMNERVELTIDGKPRKMTKRRAVTKAAISKAAKGNVTAQRTVFELDMKLNGIPEEKIERPLSAAEQQMLVSLKALLAADSGVAENGKANPEYEDE